jgi:hypothetical protein
MNKPEDDQNNSSQPRANRFLRRGRQGVRRVNWVRRIVVAVTALTGGITLAVITSGDDCEKPPSVIAVDDRDNKTVIGGDDGDRDNDGDRDDDCED